MKKIGMIGGLAWPSTIDYYRLLCKGTNTHFKSAGHSHPYPSPPLVMESLNIAYTRSLRGKHGDDVSWQQFDEVFRAAFMRLKEAGAQFGFIASNTPHMRLEAIKNGLDFPVVSILETTSEAVSRLGGKRALVLGTPVTMRDDSYPKALDEHGIDCIPRLPDRVIAELASIIDEDLYQGNSHGVREKLVNLSKHHISDPSTDIVCLACTELPLAFPEHQDAMHFIDDGITYVNTTVAHAQAVLHKALQ